MLVIGDVFAVVAILAGLFFTTYAMIFGLSLACGNVLDACARKIEGKGIGAFLVGILVGLPTFFVAALISRAPDPTIKFIGIMMMLVLFAMAMLGAGGISSVIAKRIRQLDAGTSPFAAQSKATFLLCGAMLFPFVGWLLALPAILFTGLGAVVLSAGRRSSAVEAI